ncbi:piggyBac transposable element-derived protein 4-like [Lepeophtheirus salmonis]|uniref:piggyBac transposable element-derived protein 4-like n=1 Tax=Lepeophtheirus salmonis TaxID=72036 RepID=UPI001AE81CD5|nr:piggyBac transposable element-derived protein 4-like [Lepeophtheirus salmonis]
MDEDSELLPHLPESNQAIYISKNGKIELAKTSARQPPLKSERYHQDETWPYEICSKSCSDILSSFELFLSDSIQKIILDMTNLEGGRVFGNEWSVIGKLELNAYFGILFLRVFIVPKDKSLWNSESGRPIFRPIVPCKNFKILSRVLRFDDRQTRNQRRQKDKLAPISEVWDKWVERLSYSYNPVPNVAVDERLVGLRGPCPFRQYIPSKPAKYRIKVWAACDAVSSYAWNMQIYTGKLSGDNP